MFILIFLFMVLIDKFILALSCQTFVIYNFTPNVWIVDI